MSVNVWNENGIRHGNFEIYGIKGKFPIQAITSTNLNHAETLNEPRFNFKTSFLEIIDRFPLRLVEDPEYRKSRMKKVSKTIEENPDKLCFLSLNGIRSSVRMNKERNLSIIQFQIDSGFKLIKVFFINSRNALQILKEYRNKIPEDRSIVIVLDENLDHTIFRSLYFNALEHGDEIIGFFGREPKSNNDDNKLNFQFIARRSDDKIIRLVSLIKKSFKQVVGSLIYHLFGLDVYSFLTHYGNPNVLITELKALNGFRYELLTNRTNLICAVTEMNLYYSSKRFEKVKKSSTPVSIHDIIRLNELFLELQNIHTRNELELIAGNRIF